MGCALFQILGSWKNGSSTHTVRRGSYFQIKGQEQDNVAWCLESTEFSLLVSTLLFIGMQAAEPITIIVSYHISNIQRSVPSGCNYLKTMDTAADQCCQLVDSLAKSGDFPTRNSDFYFCQTWRVTNLATVPGVGEFSVTLETDMKSCLSSSCSQQAAGAATSPSSTAKLSQAVTDSSCTLRSSPGLLQWVEEQRRPPPLQAENELRTLIPASLTEQNVKVKFYSLSH